MESPSASTGAMSEAEETPTRKLARLVRLGSVRKHPDADRLAIAQVEGWEVVVGLESQEGDLGVYFEIDSVLPAGAEWVHALGLSSNTIKTKKIRGVLSQGLFLSLRSVFSTPEDVELEVGCDLSERLGVTKRADTEDKEVRKGGKVGTRFDTVFPLGPGKTDEPRIQSNKHMLEALAGKPFYISRKYDGSSMTVQYDAEAHQLRLCSRNYAAEEGSDFFKVAQRMDLAEKLRPFSALVLQGEMYGPKVNGNRMAAKELQFAVFSVWDTRTRQRLPYPTWVELCDQLEIPHVEIVETGDSFSYTIPELLKVAQGFYPGTKNHQEGIVVRPQTPCRNKWDEPLSFKVINNDYLLQTGQ